MATVGALRISGVSLAGHPVQALPCLNLGKLFSWKLGLAGVGC